MTVSNNSPSDETSAGDPSASNTASSDNPLAPIHRSWRVPAAENSTDSTTSTEATSSSLSSGGIASAVLRWPVLWGGMAALGFYSLIRGGVLQGQFVQRYFASHPVEYLAVTLFFVAIATLILKAFDIAAQMATVNGELLEPRPAGRQPIEDCDGMLEQIDTDGPAGGSYLRNRLREAVLHVKRKASAESLDEQLRHLSDMDELRSQSSYGLVRTIIWAIPILGFLGTVIGITLAIAELNPKDFDASIQAMTAALYTAFDTTALALSLSIPLVFAVFYMVRFESRLLEAVDRRTEEELVGRFQQSAVAADPQASAVRRMGEVVVRATETLVQRQSQLWQETIGAAHQHWSQLSSHTAQQAEATITAALEASLSKHAGQLVASERSTMDQNRRHWDQLQQALVKATDTMAQQQAELVHQGQIMLKVIEATGEVKRLEDQLNSNLAALSGAKYFEDTVTSLAAAIQLLSTRLGLPLDGAREVSLSSEKAA